MSISTRLTELLKVKHPILLAPMDVVSDGRLAATVSRAGGFGIIGGGYGDETWLARELDAAGDARVGVGFITWSMAKRPRLLDLVLERRPAAVMLSFGEVRPHEAGGWDRHPFVKLPLGWGKVLLNRIYDWGYDGEPQDTMAGRRIECARGKVVGGSSTINAMAYVRGNRGDHARWTSYGLQGWSYDNVLPYFRRQESWEGGATPYRGGDGPMATRKSRYQDPLVSKLPPARATNSTMTITASARMVSRECK